MDEPTDSAGSESGCTIFIAYVADLEVWHAVWSDDDGFVADFDGQSEEEVVIWAQERCEEIWLRRPGNEIDRDKLNVNGSSLAAEDYVRLPNEAP